MEPVDWVAVLGLQEQSLAVFRVEDNTLLLPKLQNMEVLVGAFLEQSLELSLEVFLGEYLEEYQVVSLVEVLVVDNTLLLPRLLNMV